MNAFAGGLIGWGAILLVTTLVFPRKETTVDEYDRTARNTALATALSVACTAVGALLLLVAHEWLYALAGLGTAAVAYYLGQVAITWRSWSALAIDVSRERAASGGHVTVRTASRIGLLPTAAHAPWAVPHALAIKDAGDTALEITSARRRLRWAARHPRGGKPPPPL